MAKKKVIWYGICYVCEDLKVREIRVKKETAVRLYLHEESQVGWKVNTMFVNKVGGYEVWFPTRKEAVAKKLKTLRQQVRSAKDTLKQREKCLAEFKEQENA